MFSWTKCLFLQEECKPHALSKCARVHSHFLCSREPGVWSTARVNPKHSMEGMQRPKICLPKETRCCYSWGISNSSTMGCHLQTKDTSPALKGFYSKKHKMHQKYSQRVLLQTKQTKAKVYLHNNFLDVFAWNIKARFQMHLRSI